MPGPRACQVQAAWLLLAHVAVAASLGCAYKASRAPAWASLADVDDPRSPWVRGPTSVLLLLQADRRLPPAAAAGRRLPHCLALPPAACRLPVHAANPLLDALTHAPDLISDGQLSGYCWQPCWAHLGARLRGM